MALHRIEFSLFTTAELYLVSVPLVLTLRWAEVIRYTALWCPDFPRRQLPERQDGSRDLLLQKYKIYKSMSTCHFFTINIIVSLYLMKILLLGEYSRLHNSLKEGLEQLGHQVLLVGTGDSFKQFPSDIDVSSKLRKRFFLNKWWQLVYRLTGYNHFKKDIYKNLLKILPELKGFDVVQLINEDAFCIYPDDEITFYKQVFAQNEKIFLSACGEDTHVIRYYDEGHMRYSILDPFKTYPHLKNEAYYSYKYLQPAYQKLHDFVVDKVSGIIPSDLDYAIPYQGHPKALPMIPNPVNVDKIKFNKLIINDKINIFFGINRLSFYKKGSDMILEALDVIRQKYADKVHISLAENLPYTDYVKQYNSAHIFIDQLYSYDQGFNALEAMANGKCVLTGAEEEFFDYFQLKKAPAINVLPETEDVVKKLSGLIENPEKILEVSQNARRFIEKHHHYKNVAQQYVDTWQKFG